MVIKSVDSKELLPNSYVLNDYDVVCGRGRTCFNHVGNVRFREIVSTHLQRYMKVNTKTDKTIVICTIVDFIRETSPTSGGGFVKLDKSTGRYYEVGDFLAREKTSQAFRDLLEEKYKSSNANKRFNRKVLRRNIGNRSKEDSPTEDSIDENTNDCSISMNSDCYSSSRSQRNMSTSINGSVASVPSVTAKLKDVVNGTSSSLSKLDTALTNPALRSMIDSILTDIKDLKSGITTMSKKNLKHNIVRLSNLLEADNGIAESLPPPVEASQPIWWENECGMKIELHSTENQTIVESSSVEHQKICLHSTNQQDQEDYRNSLVSSDSNEYDIFNSFVPFDEEAWTILKSKGQNASK